MLALISVVTNAELILIEYGELNRIIIVNHSQFFETNVKEYFTNAFVSGSSVLFTIWSVLAVFCSDVCEKIDHNRSYFQTLVHYRTGAITEV